MESISKVNCVRLFKTRATQTLKSVTSMENTSSKGTIVLVETVIVDIRDNLQNESIKVENINVETMSGEGENRTENFESNTQEPRQNL